VTWLVRSGQGSSGFRVDHYLLFYLTVKYTPIPNIVVRAKCNKQEADDRKGLLESPN